MYSIKDIKTKTDDCLWKAILSVKIKRLAKAGSLSYGSVPLEDCRWYTDTIENGGQLIEATSLGYEKGEIGVRTNEKFIKLSDMCAQEMSIVYNSALRHTSIN